MTDFEHIERITLIAFPAGMPCPTATLKRGYETVQALAIFWYLENLNEKWKTSGIKDEDIREVHFSPDGAEESERRIRYSVFQRNSVNVHIVAGNIDSTAVGARFV